jgi:hypothetical protein
MAYFGQTITEKLSQADDYYAVDNHIKYLDWNAYSDNEQKAALQQSEREINLYLGLDLAENYSSTDWPISGLPNYRPDFAIFEQALFILDNTARTKSAATSATTIESEDYQEEERNTGLGIAPQATRFLQMKVTQIERG